MVSRLLLWSTVAHVLLQQKVRINWIKMAKKHGGKKGSMIRWLGHIFTALLIAAIVNQIEVEPEAHTEAAPPQFVGALAVNNELEKKEGKSYFKGQIDGPEALAVYKGEVYTGLLNGTIVKFRFTEGFSDNPELVHVVHTGISKKCDTTHNEEQCGRPVGLRFNEKGDLYFVDVYFGLLKYNVNTGKLDTLFSSKDTRVNGKSVKLPNDLALTKEGDVYFSDSTSKWPIKEALLEMIESSPNGRLLHYSAKTGKVTEVASGLYFPNGVQLSSDESYLLFSETTRARVMKYTIKGPKAGKVEIFADNLPGMPDNIRPSGRGGFWVGMCGVRMPNTTPSTALLAPYPTARKIIGKTIYLSLKIVEGVEKIVQSIPIPSVHYGIRNVAHYLPHLSIAKYTLPNYGLAIELNEQGEITRSLHSPNGLVKYISHIEEYNGHYYIGSPWNDYIYKLKT